MSVESYLENPQDVVELHGFVTSTPQPPPALRLREISNTLTPPVAPLFASEVLSSNHVHRKVDEVRSNYIITIDSHHPPPTTLSGVADTHTPTTPTSNNLSMSQPLNPHEMDVTPVSQQSSFLCENDNLQLATAVSNNRASLYPAGDFRNSSMPDINDMKAEIMCNYLHQQQMKKMWSNGGREEGVILRKSREEYTCCPPDLQLQKHGLFDATRRLNVRVCERN